jgi:hypothetical protein
MRPMVVKVGSETVCEMITATVTPGDVGVYGNVESSIEFSQAGRTVGEYSKAGSVWFKRGMT